VACQLLYDAKKNQEKFIFVRKNLFIAHNDAARNINIVLYNNKVYCYIE
jgi:hypothetical protein